MMKRVAHWNLTYLINRTNIWVHEKRRPDEPWLTRDMISILDGWLKDSDIGIEWGAGRSTVWFANRVSHITSIEHSHEWSCIVEKKLIKHNLRDKVELLTCEKGDKPGYENCLSFYFFHIVAFYLVSFFVIK